MSNSTKPVRLVRGANFLNTNPVGNSDDLTVSSDVFGDKLLLGECVANDYKWLIILPHLLSGAELDLVATFPEPKDDATRNRITWHKDAFNPTATGLPYHTVPNKWGFEYAHPVTGKTVKPEFVTRPMLSGTHLAPLALLSGVYGKQTLPMVNDNMVRIPVTRG